MAEQMMSALEHMLGVVKDQGGHLVIQIDSLGQWVVGCVFGQEAPDSPMAGGAAYGIDPEMSGAIMRAAQDMGWKRECFLHCYDTNGRVIGGWQMHTAVNSLADAPIEATAAIERAFLVVVDDGGAKRILKSRDILSNEGVDPDELIAELRKHPLTTVAGPQDLANATRPRVDGTKCPWRGRDEANPGAGFTLGCPLDTGHEGDHDPVPLENL